MRDGRKLPPVWLMGLTNATFGMMGGFAVVTLPQMLAAQNVPGGSIARMVAVVTSGAFWVCAISPVLDVRFSRRAYALATALLTAATVMFTILHRTDVRLIEWMMVAGFAAASLYQGAVGGWMGSLIQKEQDGQLGMWFAVSNIGAGGIAIALSGELLQKAAPWMAASVMAALLLLPLTLFLFIPAPGPDRKLASDSFRRFAGDIAALMRRRQVVTALLMFVLPSASFALTNVLAGIGKDFSASERVVSLSGGIGGIAAGLLGSFALAPLAKRLPLRPLYLGVGVAGAMFTLALLTLPRGPATFALAITGENIFQSLAFATANAISFETIGPGNPLAATLFTVLIAVSNLPILYMAYIDGAGYTWHGVAGAFSVDAALGLTACVALMMLARRGTFRPAQA